MEGEFFKRNTGRNPSKNEERDFVTIVHRSPKSGTPILTKPYWGPRRVSAK